MTQDGEGAVPAMTVVGIALASALVPLNSTMIAVAVPSISRTVDHDPGAVTQALVATYLIAAIALQSTGGKLEGFYFAFGDADALVIVDAPDNASIAAASMAIGASGLVTCTTVVLLTPEEVDQAVKKGATYTPPGR